MIRLGPSLFSLFVGGFTALSGPQLQAHDAGAESKAPSEVSVQSDAADEGARDLERAGPVLKKLVTSQPYGRTWRSLAKTSPAPRNRVGTGDAEAPKTLGQDTVELQQQSQYLEPTTTEVRFGFAAIRGVRVFRYGRLRAVRLHVEPIGKTRDDFVRDVEALSTAWSNPAASLGVEAGFAVARNDLVDPKKKLSSEWPKAPLVIELVPRERAAR